MRILHLYIAKTVLASIVIVLLVLVGLNFIGVIADQVGSIKGQYTFLKVVEYALLKIPGIMSESVGFSAMIGCMVGLGVLANNSELTVMRASGVSLYQVVMMVITPVFFMIFLGVALEEVAVYTDRQANTTRFLSRLGHVDVSSSQEEFLSRRSSRAAMWNRQGNEFVRIDRLLADGGVLDVTRIAFDESRQIISIHKAEKGFYGKQLWHLEGVETASFNDAGFVRHKIPQQIWYSDLTPERLLFVAEEPESLSVEELTDYSSFLKQQGRDNRDYQLAYWKKIFSPLVVASLVLLAVSFVFGSVRQVAIAQRVFVGAIVGVSFHIGQDIVGTASLVFGFSPLSAVLLPIVACASVGLVLLHRVR